MQLNILQHTEQHPTIKICLAPMLIALRLKAALKKHTIKTIFSSSLNNFSKYYMQVIQECSSQNLSKTQFPYRSFSIYVQRAYIFKKHSITLEKKVEYKTSIYCTCLLSMCLGTFTKQTTPAIVPLVYLIHNRTLGHDLVQFMFCLRTADQKDAVIFV